MSQIGLPFDWQEQGGQGQFIAGEANRIALAHIESWRSWPIPISILSGPPRSGKTALARHFATISGGVVIDEANRQPNEALFHQWNIARDSGVPLLLIAREAPELWTVALPDLRSRLAAAPHVRIEEPDDALMLALIETGLAQAGSAYAPDVPEWLSRRIERSYAALAAALDQLNRASLAAARKISIASAKEALQNSHLFSIEDKDG
ncbi:HdaA/DnaA family protein [Sphingobium fluviale]|uniref:Chromosomal replication initiator DnaA n=1 Tax=Sphingobium fluviale TaxID=2506423 RepID=A0A4Q1KQ67_9SPHN|nr:DnaA/Hda family protein [Sphingobium fluviale]RXR31044.1 chromosomal replication initiator DnaA [Sphingobium fluviale]